MPTIVGRDFPNPNRNRYESKSDWEWAWHLFWPVDSHSLRKLYICCRWFKYFFRVFHHLEHLCGLSYRQTWKIHQQFDDFRSDLHKNAQIFHIWSYDFPTVWFSMIFPICSYDFPYYVPMIFQLFMAYFPLPEAFANFRQARLAQDYAQKLRSYALWRRRWQKPVELVDPNDIR